MFFPKDKSKCAEYFQMSMLYQLEYERAVLFNHRCNTPNSIYLRDFSQLIPCTLQESFVLPSIIDRMDFFGDRIFLKTELSCQIKSIILPESSND